MATATLRKIDKEIEKNYVIAFKNQGKGARFEKPVRKIAKLELKREKLIG